MNPACFHIVDRTDDLEFAVHLGIMQKLAVLNEFGHLVANKCLDGMAQLFLLGKVCVFLMDLFNSGSERFG